MPAVLEREAARLFSTAVFRPLASGRSSDRADSAVHRLRDELRLGKNVTNLGVVAAAYALMQQRYRSEYFYRNLIASKIFVGRHNATNSVLLNEFRLGGSVADCVLVNGKGSVYEIKTEFDSPEKLATQIADYYKAFPYVNVVAHAGDVEKYRRLLENTPVGLIAVGPRARLSRVKPAEPRTERFEIRTMFNMLRAREAAEVLKQWFGGVPDVPNGLRYEAFAALAAQIPVLHFQAAMQDMLKRRQLQNSRHMMLNEALLPLRALLAQLDPDAEQQRNLATWLRSKGD